MTTAAPSQHDARPGFPARWSGPLFVCGLLGLCMTMSTVAVILILGAGKEGNREIPHAYAEAVREATASREAQLPAPQAPSR